MALKSNYLLDPIGLRNAASDNRLAYPREVLGFVKFEFNSFSNNPSNTFKCQVKPITADIFYLSKTKLSRSTPPQILFSGFNSLQRNLKVVANSSAANVGPLSNDYGDGNGNDGGNKGTGGGGGGGGGNEDSGSGGEFNKKNGADNSFLLGALTKGWNDRVTADPQFVFKVFTEQVIGVSACVLGDMASRPNFGLNELDFVFSTMVVGSLVNFLLMYMLAPVSVSSAAATLPGIFSRSPVGHMFEAGSYNAFHRAGTFVYKGLQFASAGFIAGLLGTAISNALLFLRKKIQPEFDLQNPSPPTLLNASTWALHLGISSNLRYQCLNGLDGILSQKLSPSAFRAFVFCIRGANNVIGGSTFAMLAKYTGAQKAAEK